jgi:pimeloyl-ACP methyl ester carboxylesterase
VWGHSHGAIIALIQAAQGNCKPSATVAVSVALLPGGILKWLTTSYYQLGRVMPTTLRKLWLTNRVTANASGRVLFKTTRGQDLNALLAEGILDLPTIKPDVILEEYLSAIHTDLDPYVSSISAPVLFVAGARDIIAPLSQVRSLVSKAPLGTLQIMWDQGHMVPIEVPGATAALTKRFLNSIGAHQ